MKDINIEFKNLVETLKKDNTVKIEEKNSYSYIEIKNHIKYLKTIIIRKVKPLILNILKNT